jgi:hypothetical protein
MSVIEFNARANAKQVRDRLNNPKNSFRDNGINMRNGTPLPPPPDIEPARLPPAAVIPMIAKAIGVAPNLPTEDNEASDAVIVIQWPTGSAFMTARIIRLVAKTYGVTATDVVSDRRTANVVRPRQIAMFLAKTLTQRSLPWIGRQFGNRDHTTVLHAVNKIKRLRDEDPELDAQIQQFAALIRPQEVT